jgi:hypothetical protein
VVARSTGCLCAPRLPRHPVPNARSAGISSIPAVFGTRTVCPASRESLLHLPRFGPHPNDRSDAHACARPPRRAKPASRQSGISCTRLSPTEDGCDSTAVNKKERRRQASGTPTLRETLEVDALLADLDRAREMFEAAERRARTYLVRRGVIDQTYRDLPSLLRECLPAQDADHAPRGSRGRS